MIEVERKFVVDDNTSMQGLKTLEPALRVGSVETIDLDAMYYDTLDYRLARSGATLRLRLGGADAGWHLKLPGAEPDSRIELQRPAPGIDAAALFSNPPAVPKEFVDLTLARSGGAALQPVVRLTTRRTKTLLVGPESQRIAEVDEDEVGAFLNGGTEPHDHWKELEVELIEGTRGQLEKISRQLERLGGRPADYGSKFLRAVGSAAGRPFLAEPAAIKTENDPVGRVFLKRWHDLVLELITRDVGVRLGDGEAVHKMRVAIRRLRSALRTFTPLLDKESVLWLREELGWLGGVLGPVRDTDVLRAHLGELLDSLSPSEVLGPVRDELSAYFAETRQKALAESLEALCSQRYLDLVDVLRAVTLAPPTTAKAETSIKKAAPRLLGRELQRVAKRIAAATAAEGTEGHEHALHDVRKAAKGMRYAAEAFEPVVGKPARRIAQRFVAIHELLGAGQDAVVARDLLRDLGARAGVRQGHNGYTYGLLAGLEACRFDRAAHELPALWKAASADKLWEALER